MLYFSRGSFRGSLRSGASVCPGTVASEPRTRMKMADSSLLIGDMRWRITQVVEVVKVGVLNR